MLITSILMLSLGGTARGEGAAPVGGAIIYETQTCTNVATSRRYDANGAEVGRGGRAVDAYVGTRRTRKVGSVSFIETEATRGTDGGKNVVIKSSLRKESIDQDGIRYENLSWTTTKIEDGRVTTALPTTEQNLYKIEGADLILISRILNQKSVPVNERIKEIETPGRREVTTVSEGPYLVRATADGEFNIVSSSESTCVFEVPTS